MDDMPRRVVARYDPSLDVRVVRSTPLHYADGASAQDDRPAHVRAGSSLCWAGGRIVVVQDDSNFIALVDPRSGEVVPVTLPAGAGGRRQFDDVRGNKADKLDLEAVVTIGETPSELVVAFGSGSTPHRESILVMRGLSLIGSGATVSLFPAPAFYAGLRAELEFAGSELNIEGAMHIRVDGADRVRLFNRGNGAARGDLTAVNSSADVDATALLAHLEHAVTVESPRPTRIVHYDLGHIDGSVLTFTDVATVPTKDATGALRFIYVAAAEASPDAVRDGPVAGCAVGVAIERDEGIEARWTILRDASQNVFTGKVEGIALDRHTPGRAFLVVDRDTPSSASELLEVEVTDLLLDR
jgi:hypothetical protein